ncbi:hypothetical protein ACTJIJ_13895 [Niabella sp. 22666]|uniref:hypothetical protein n=1 Tax=Niabella sp. 22666 TaxID=3453954 RepID=UPI003F866CAD
MPQVTLANGHISTIIQRRVNTPVTATGNGAVLKLEDVTNQPYQNLGLWNVGQNNVAIAPLNLNNHKYRISFHNYGQVTSVTIFY